MEKPRDLFIIGCALIFLVLCTGCTGNTAGKSMVSPDDPSKGWKLTLNGTSEKILSYDELRVLPSVTAHGYCVSTTGIRFGPYLCKGVDLRDLITLTGGMGRKDQVWVSAPDGYLWVFDYDQLQGKGFVTFNESLKEIPSPELKIILMYEQDGKPLTYNDGGPARIAIVSGEKGVITEGSAWVKWVDRIEIRRK